jgi:predicted small lipoprotein YifL
MIPPSVSISAFPIDDTMRATLCAGLLGSALYLAACGIKGPLYMPKVPPMPSKVSPATGGADHNKAPAPATESR